MIQNDEQLDIVRMQLARMEFVLEGLQREVLPHSRQREELKQKLDRGEEPYLVEALSEETYRRGTSPARSACPTSRSSSGPRGSCRINSARSSATVPTSSEGSAS